MNLLLPLAIGAVILIASQSNSSTSTTKKDEKDGGLVIEGSIVKPKNPKKPIGSLSLGGQSQIKCPMNQYYNEETKKCTDFWIPGQTDEDVKHQILEEAAKFYNKPDLGNAYVGELCEDKWQGNDIEGTWIANPNQMAIIKTVIFKMWDIPMNLLPPKKTDPAWLHTIWNNVINLYSEVICMNG